MLTFPLEKTVTAVGYAIQHFKNLDDEFIESLIAKGDIFTCAGGFIVEEMDGHLGYVKA